MHPLFVPFRETPSLDNVVRRWCDGTETRPIPKTNTPRRKRHGRSACQLPGCSCGSCTVYNAGADIKHGVGVENMFIWRITYGCMDGGRLASDQKPREAFRRQTAGEGNAKSAADTSFSP